MAKHNFRGNGRRIPAVLLGLLAPFLGPQVLADATPSLKNGELKESGALQYVGGTTRVGVGYDSQTKLRGEIYQVITEADTSALIADAWLARAAGGLKLSYHFLPSDADFKNTNLSVYKMFGALDQNERHDRKVSLGGGYETADHFASAYLSKGLTGKRLISADSSSSQTQITGTDLNRPYVDTTTTTLYTQIFERAYDYGLGMRLGRMLEPSLLRVTGGLDYEWGKSLASQGTISLNLEKFFAGSPHSLALHLDAARKSGDYETSNNHYSAMLMYRYEFGGKAYRSEHLLRDVPVSTQSVVQPVTGNLKKIVIQQPARTEKKIIKTTVSMASDAFFLLDSTQLTDVAKTELDQVARVLKDSGYQGNVRIGGYTCDLGPAAYNLKLSRKRAEAVRDYLVGKGVVTSDAVIVEGFGKSKAKYPATKAERHKNRRVDIEYVTYQNKEEIVVIPAVSVEVPEEAAPPVVVNSVQWQQEEVAQEPAWMRRALHNTAQHKRTVDYYRFAEKQQTVATQREWVNQAPVAADDTFVAIAGMSLDLSVLSNDRDPDGDQITLISATTPRFGSVSVIGEKLRYVAQQGFSGQDTFTYRIRDPKGLESTAVVTLNVSVPNQVPVAADDVATTQQDAPVTVNVLSNDTDPDGDNLVLASVSAAPAHGSAVIKSGQIEYTPVRGYAGTDSFSYIVQDGRGGSATAIARVSVVQANKMPTAADDVATTQQDVPVTVNVLGNDADPDGDNLVLASVSAAPAHGSAVIKSGQIEYTPVRGYAGTDSFSYIVQDGRGGSATAIARVSVVQANKMPTAADDVATTQQDAPVTVNVLSNDADPDGDNLILASVSAAPAHGSVVIKSGQVEYTPARGYAGTDSFSYIVQDGRGGSAIAQVSVRVIPANIAPSAQNDWYLVPGTRDSTLDVLSNDTDPDGDALSIIAVTQPKVGSVRVEGNKLIFSPRSVFWDSQFTYTVSDGRGGVSTAIVTLVDP